MQIVACMANSSFAFWNFLKLKKKTFGDVEPRDIVGGYNTLSGLSSRNSFSEFQRLEF